MDWFVFFSGFMFPFGLAITWSWWRDRTAEARALRRLKDRERKAKMRALSASLPGGTRPHTRPVIFRPTSRDRTSAVHLDDPNREK